MADLSCAVFHLDSPLIDRFHLHIRPERELLQVVYQGFQVHQNQSFPVSAIAGLSDSVAIYFVVKFDLCSSDLSSYLHARAVEVELA